MAGTKITWFRQGYWDGLCGFYASLNYMWALFPKLRNSGAEKHYKTQFRDCAKQHQVFDEAVDLLSRVGGTTIRTPQGHSGIGGIDQFRIEELLLKMSRFWELPIKTELLHEIRDQKRSLESLFLGRAL